MVPKSIKMKPVLLLLSLACIAISSPVSSQQLNFDFEDWLEFELYQEPEVYETSNFQSFFGALSPNVTRVPGINGSAIRLENKAFQLDTTVVPGLLYVGDLASFPSGGLAYPYTVPDSLILTARYDIQPGDSGLVLLLFKRFGFPVSVNVFPVTGRSAGFQRFSLPLTPSGIAPDSLVLIISSGNLNNPLEGSFMEIDDMQFSNTVRQLPNNDFEKWETIRFEEPDGWTGANVLSAILRVPKSIEKTTNASKGNFALSLTQRSINKLGIQENVGLCFMGDAASGTPKGVAFQSSQFKLTMDYLYEPQGQDTAWMLVLGTRYDASRFRTDTLLRREVPLVRSSSYKEIELVTSVLGTSTDTILIAFSASNDFPGKANPGTLREGSRLLVDNIRVQQVSASSDQELPGWDIGPNPAMDFIRLSGLPASSNYLIRDAVGRTIGAGTCPGPDMQLDTDHLPSGKYYLLVSDRNKSGVKSFIIQK